MSRRARWAPPAVGAAGGALGVALLRAVEPDHGAGLLHDASHLALVGVLVALLGALVSRPADARAFARAALVAAIAWLAVTLMLLVAR